MKAVVCTKFDGPAGLSVQSVEAPEPARDEVLIAVDSASVNFIDLLISRGLYQIRPDLPYVVGAEGAGEVIAVGADVENVGPGERVAAFHLFGAFAEQFAVKHWRTVALPDSVAYGSGAAILHNYITAAYALMVRGQIKPGETLVVHGATGGVGLAAVELGKLWGATVIAGVGSDAKSALAREYGAAEIINYGQEDIRERIGDLTKGRGADLIYDPIGGDIFDQSVRALAWEGRILVIGFAAGRIAQVGANRPLLKSASIVGVNTGAWPEQNPQAFQALAAEVMDLAGAGKVNPKISRTLPLEDFRIAMDAIDDRTAQGRMILQIGK